MYAYRPACDTCNWLQAFCFAANDACAWALSNDVVQVHSLIVVDVICYHSQLDLRDAGQKHCLLNTGAQHQNSEYGISSCPRSSEAHANAV